ncbi:hypothetical protein TR75_10625 [Hydrogenibacillus schlegelii]|uniref:magnesium transporter CorA family protein n=1 Tax=Hydrogenibacillus schlegelii TaxID=1484 RepID=UPI0007925A27|nr:magnesium transporter CorA family protein [Hydrogenibacillus schlegelii]KWW97090.1 hypothetical protein TR75_10625 [Hydrogenibacillus schlegelii]
MLEVRLTMPDGRIAVHPAPAEERDAAFGGFPKNSVLTLFDPTPEELGRVARAFHLDEAYLRDALDPLERPRVEVGETEDGAPVLILVLGLPHQNGDAASDGRPGSMPYGVMPVSLVHLKDHLLVVARRAHPAILDVLDGRRAPVATHMKTRLTLLIFQAVAEAYLAALRELRALSRAIERRLRAAHRNRELFMLLGVNKSLVYFASALRASVIVYRRLLAGRDLKLFADDADLLRSALVDLEQAEELTALHADRLSTLMDAYAAVIHNNVNAVLKVLTTLTVVLTLPVLIAGLFTINTRLPFEDAPWLFGLLLLAMIVSGGALVLYFYQRNFLRW